jgi:pimeloyl-ACP methyl ester carboxylesterase
LKENQLRQLTATDSGIRYIEITPAHISSDITYLLVHGLGGSLEQWSEVAQRLGEEARTIAIDVPGFGKSRTAWGNFDLDIAVEQIFRFCLSKSVARCILVSHSVGSVVAARLAAVAPTIFTRLIFVSGTLVRASKMVQHPRQALSNPRLGLFVAAQFLAGVLPIPHIVLRTVAMSPPLKDLTLWPFVAYPAEIPSNRLVETLTGSGSPSVLRILFTAKSINYVAIMSAVTQPVDLIWGTEDHLINSEDIDCTHRLVHVAREQTIERCGHWPWLENPSELISFITSPGIDSA